MEIILAENSGFCFGVKRAMNIAQEAIRNTRVPVYSLGPIIHNPQEVDRLARLGGTYAEVPSAVRD